MNTVGMQGGTEGKMRWGGGRGGLRRSVCGKGSFAVLTWAGISPMQLSEVRCICPQRREDTGVRHWVAPELLLTPVQLVLLMPASLPGKYQDASRSLIPLGTPCRWRKRGV